MADKLLTFHGPTAFLEVPGFFTIPLGKSHRIDEHVADAVERANPDIDITISDLPAKRGGGKRHLSQPEAHQGEGHATANDLQKE